MAIFDVSESPRYIADYDANVPRLKKRILELGGMVKDDFYIHPSEAHKTIIQCKNNLWANYFGTSDLNVIFDRVKNDTDSFRSEPEEYRQFYTNYKNFLARMENDVELGLTNKWSRNYDPVSKTIILFIISIQTDNEVFDFSNESKIWLEHNLNYLDKIGYTSQYHYDLLKESVKMYQGAPYRKLTDGEIEAIASSIVLLQKPIVGMSLKPYPIELTHDVATEKNTRGAESGPGFANQKNNEVKERVLENAKWILENGTYHDIHPANRQHRIQSGGNIIRKFCNISINAQTGKIDFSENSLVAAVRQILDTRGTFTTYMEKEPEIFDLLSGLITYESLPSSLMERQILVDNGEAPEYILRRFKDINDWQYHYKVNCPNIFTLIGDKYDDRLQEYHDKIYTKHRGICALPACYSRIGQRYLYPHMELRKQILMKDYSPYYSMVAQWTHPDNLRQLFTDMIIAAHSEDYVDENVTTTYSVDQLNSFAKYVTDFSMFMTSDDKTGFDTSNKPYMAWAYLCCFLSLPYDLNDEETLRMFQTFSLQLQFNVVIEADGLYIYSAMIPSGMSFTSDAGTFDSNTSNIAINSIMAGLFDDEYPEFISADEGDETDKSPFTEEVGSDPDVNDENDEEVDPMEVTE